jgi:hypothetical protein
MATYSGLIRRMAKSSTSGSAATMRAETMFRA